MDDQEQKQNRLLIKLENIQINLNNVKQQCKNLS